MIQFGSRSTPFRLKTVVLILAMGVTSVSCASDREEDRDPSTSATAYAGDQPYLFDNIVARGDTVMLEPGAESLAEYLPNQTFVFDGKPSGPASEGVVKGSVVQAVGAQGYYVPSGDAESGTAIGFDDPRAQWRVIEATIEVEDSIGLGNPETVGIGVVVDVSDTKSLVNAVKNLGTVVVVVGGQGFFKFDKELYYAERVGSLIGQVSSDGRITFPALATTEETKESAFVAGLDTWEAIKAEAAQPKEPIVFEAAQRK